MVRLARVAELGVAYHVTQRGNNRQDVFFVDDDRRIYLEILKKESKKYRMEVHGYCLMTQKNGDSHRFIDGIEEDMIQWSYG
jgi:putative transposase